ncbi:MAG: nickel transporter [Burkholderiales bacterium]|jgi:high-affinity nickel-transport protein|nr:nickel transporter [Burkholderiales bacterium]
MSIPTDDWLALVALALTLGLKHGLDADHLVAIDGLTRFNAQFRPRFARWCGVFFSLGHGIVVIAVAVLVGLAADRWIVPGWLEDLGAWISIAFLAGLGIVNLVAVASTPPEDVVRTVAFRGRLLGRLMRTSNPFAILLVGALFALSFDTMSQAALFAVAASTIGSWTDGAVLAGVFMLGMTIADGVNGFWISSLLGSANRRARVASRVMGLAVGGLSLALAGFGAAKYFSGSLDAWFEGRELGMGLAVIAFVAAAFAFGMVLARRPAGDARAAAGSAAR